MSTRRKFLKTAALTGAGLTIGAPAIGKNILGANRRVNVAMFGVNGRGGALTKTFAKATDSWIHGIGDVDSRAVEKTQKAVYDLKGHRPTGNQDFRRFLDDRDVDAVVIATPDHWHAPMAIMALEAGKDVYLEKPCSHNPQEGEWLVAKQKKTGKLVQMGNQTRSSVTLNKIVKEIKEGLIGEAYAGKAWYANTRGGIGSPKKTYRPEWLNWELWQGPAPRKDYHEGYVHYNWHWYWDYGTGEILNNGTHEIDMCRWALGVDYPTRVTSSGGRFHFNDGWEAFDTQNVGYEFADKKTINWEGRSCNGMPFWNRGRGSLIHGTEGTVLMDRQGYWVYDLKGKEIRKEMEAAKSVSMDVRGGGGLDDLHIRNFISAINSGEALNSPIDDANTSVTICHLGNIAQRTTGSLDLDPKTGKPLNNPAALELWGREYEKGWTPKV
ncbi:twin-arginine translocation signal domain-containing protein [Neolewinella aurantiaca]|uniref:Twin-arginine translocation signal domain-containing protein n=1 Tax=Neolewinella aurantiaca TaxID=2602767 RepID=A0A5C7FU37_9BACT|nr:Gfo/Idh/MocA family oxidoreductase [Neolewinella aurantiaca]TXF88387.1 twin-arginine translocation signal domain-containing protein [Neolewinella aurantiaca]